MAIACTSVAQPIKTRPGYRPVVSATWAQLPTMCPLRVRITIAPNHDKISAWQCRTWCTNESNGHKSHSYLVLFRRLKSNQVLDVCELVRLVETVPHDLSKMDFKPVHSSPWVSNTAIYSLVAIGLTIFGLACLKRYRFVQRCDKLTG